jgi:hypothetical protein
MIGSDRAAVSVLRSEGRIVGMIVLNTINGLLCLTKNEINRLMMPVNAKQRTDP